jgi:integrase
MTHSKSGRVKPKPHPNFPLFRHQSGRWCKKILGKHHYFGPVTPDGNHGAQAALERWLDQKDDLLVGRTPRVKGEGLTVRELVNHFLSAKRHLLDTREIRPTTWGDYYATCERLVRVFGKDRLVSDLTADDFARLRADFAKTRGPVCLSGDITMTRMVFKHGWDAGLLSAPVRSGPGFKRPSLKVLRLARKQRAPRMFDRTEIRALIDAAGVQLRAMIYLGINCGYGNQDCATLPLDALDLEGGWVNYHRPKTGIDRRCPLWPETVEALKAALVARPTPKDPDVAKLVFVTSRLRSWSKDTMDNPVAKEFAKVLKALGLQRKGRGFYSLRHTFETIAGGSRDQVAVDHVMGRAPAQNDMSAVYREGIDDSRLVAVVNHVRQWLFGSESKR